MSKKTDIAVLAGALVGLAGDLPETILGSRQTQPKHQKPTGNPSRDSIIRRCRRAAIRLRNVVTGWYRDIGPQVVRQGVSPTDLDTRQRRRAVARKNRFEEITIQFEQENRPARRGLALRPFRPKNRFKSPRAGRMSAQRISS